MRGLDVSSLADVWAQLALSRERRDLVGRYKGSKSLLHA